MPVSFFLRWLSWWVLPVGVALAAGVLPMNAVAASPPGAAPVAGERIDPGDFNAPLLAAAVFEETNRQRAGFHLPAFLPDEKAAEAARQHARWMADRHVLSHDEPSGGGTPVTSLDRLERQGLRPHVAAENIAYNLLLDLTPGRPFYTRTVDGRAVYSYRPGGAELGARTYGEFARVIVAQWMHSPMHRAHIVGPELRFLGVGVALAHRPGRPDTIYGVQDFFTPHDPAERP